jgi:hypothetical protein
LRLIIGRLEDFGARVRTEIEQMGWLQRRELIRTLVKRVEIDQDEVTVVFRVQPTPDPSAPDPFLPDCGRRGEPRARQPIQRLMRLTPGWGVSIQTFPGAATQMTG